MTQKRESKCLLMDVNERERSIGVSEFHSGTTQIKKLMSCLLRFVELYCSLFRNNDLVQDEANDT